jgi:hypothetical protein
MFISQNQGAGGRIQQDCPETQVKSPLIKRLLIPLSIISIHSKHPAIPQLPVPATETVIAPRIAGIAVDVVTIVRAPATA